MAADDPKRSRGKDTTSQPRSRLNQPLGASLWSAFRGWPRDAACGDHDASAPAWSPKKTTRTSEGASCLHIIRAFNSRVQLSLVLWREHLPPPGPAAERVSSGVLRCCHPVGMGNLGRVPGGVARALALPPATSYNACGISPPQGRGIQGPRLKGFARLAKRETSMGKEHGIHRMGGAPPSMPSKHANEGRKRHWPCRNQPSTTPPLHSPRAATKQWRPAIRPATQ